ncbi:MAG: NAD-dependent epimerase/dehydratase family protein [Candidatus Omnitrophica bacterium]|nr:NAD-dependent epimerase/dehydratase family protein [Candidatus Omnitrophota bacterium]
MNKEILIVGGGYLGQRLQTEFNCRLFQGRITTFKESVKVVKKYKPKILINCIGATGKRNVDDCELDKDKTLMANTFVPLILAEAALRAKIKLVHISSGCIYNFNYSKKQKPISEKLTPDFYQLFYSRSKAYSDSALDVFSKDLNFLIARIRIPLDDRPNPKNVLDKLIKYKTVIDIPNSVTYIPDFIKALKHLIKVDAKGIYNVVNKGGLRYPDLMKIYKKYKPDFKYDILKYKDLKLVRTNLILSTSKLEKAGFKVRPISKVLEECVKKYVAHRS